MEHRQLLLKSSLTNIPQLFRLLKRRISCLLTRRPYVLIRESQILLETQSTLANEYDVIDLVSLVKDDLTLAMALDPELLAETFEFGLRPALERL